ncbi:unnamed protein product [Orchesella dallaii]|uniref:Cytochrome b5 heme-binding domain-containing protein n=1 Tax=Orchesella dallaii TaxID=48710 RepID=A0ABP1QXD8_9HEXA
MAMWFTVEQKKPDIGTVIFKADDYCEKLAHITGIWNDNKFLYYEMFHSASDSSAEEETDAKKVFSVSDITDVPMLLAYLERANMSGALPLDMVDFMWDLHKLYVTKMAEFGHAVQWMSKKDFTMLENREKWAKLVKEMEERHFKTFKAEHEAKKRKRKLKPTEIKLYDGVDSPPPTEGKDDKTGSKDDSKGRGGGGDVKRKGKSKTQWQLFMEDRIKHPSTWDFGKTSLFDRKHVRIVGKHVEFTRFYHKLQKALRFAKYEPTDWRIITLAEIDKHRYENDCWMVIKGRVYDVTSYVYKHPGGSNLLMQGVGIDATHLFVAIHPYVVFYNRLMGKQIGTLPNYKEHAHTEWEPPTSFNIFRTILDWWFRPKNPYVNLKPKTDFKQFDTHYTYTVSFPKGKITSTEEDWTITIARGCLVTIIKHVDTPYVWYGGLSLRNRVMDDTVYRTFSADYNTLRLEIKKPYKDETRPYTPICLVDEFEEKFEEESGGFQTLFFLIKEFKNGDFTSMLHHMPTDSIVEGIDVYISPAMGNFKPNFLFLDMDVMLLIAGGTGISVMTRIIQEYIGRKEELTNKVVILLLFVQYRGDVIWKDTWMDLDRNYTWFHFFYSLTRVYRYTIDNGDGHNADEKRNSAKLDFNRKSSSTGNKDEGKKDEARGSGASSNNNQIRGSLTIMETNLTNPQELYGYPATAKLRHVFDQIPQTKEATQHKAIVCGPYGFNHSCKR